MAIISGGSSGSTTAQVVASGKVVPVADAVGVTVNTTTYNDTVKGSGKLTTLVFPAEQGAIAIAVAGDAFPRFLLTADPIDAGICMGDGTVDPYLSGTFVSASSAPLSGLRGSPADGGSAVPHMGQLSSRFAITNNPLPTQQFISGAAAQLAAPGDARDCETHTPVTFNPGAATTATCLVQISPDNVTYSTLCTWVEPAGVALDGTVHDVTARVPGSWWMKLTVNGQAVLGLTTYY